MGKNNQAGQPRRYKITYESKLLRFDCILKYRKRYHILRHIHFGFTAKSDNISVSKIISSNIEK